jgi:hypothetical protein
MVRKNRSLILLVIPHIYYLFLAGAVDLSAQARME